MPALNARRRLVTHSPKLIYLPRLLLGKKFKARLLAKIAMRLKRMIVQTHSFPSLITTSMNTPTR